MQAFYPSTPQHTRALVLLALLVLVLHGLGLQSMSKSWPQATPAVQFVQIQRQATIAPVTAVAQAVTPPRSAPKPAAKPKRQSEGMRLGDPDASAPPKPDTASTDSPSTDASSTDLATDETNLPAEATSSAALEQPPAAPMRPDPPDQTAAPTPEPLTPPAPLTASSWLTEAQFVWPASTKLVFEVVGESKGIRYSAEGDLVWQHDGGQYQMRQEVRHMLLGARSQTSAGALSAQGLQPLRFGDKYKQEQAAHFEREKNTISFSSNAPSQTLQAGAQDRLSVMAQLAGLMNGSPIFRQAGQQLQLQVASARSADVWLFVVEKTETLKLPVGSLPTLKISRLSTQPYAQTLEIWLSPSHGYLPAKVRIAQSNGDVLEQFLRKAEKP